MAVGAGLVWLAILGPVRVPADKATGNGPERPTHGIPAPNPALLTPSPADATWKIPHTGPHGLMPMHYYAARVATPDGAHRVAIMVGGLGESLEASLAAVKDLPAAVSLALTPYGAHLTNVADAARKAGHEMLMGLAMQTDREPAATEGDDALHDGALVAVNRKRLDWMLSRAAGYAGVTDEIGMKVNETYLTHDLSRQWLGKQLQADGLFLVAVSSDTAVPSGMQGRKADVVIHPDMSAAQQQDALKRLETIAIAKGSALGVVSSPTKGDVATLAQWSKGLAADGVTLVPVSALAAPVESR